MVGLVARGSSFVARRSLLGLTSARSTLEGGRRINLHQNRFGMKPVSAKPVWNGRLKPLSHKPKPVWPLGVNRFQSIFDEILAKKSSFR